MFYYAAPASFISIACPFKSAPLIFLASFTRTFFSYYGIKYSICYGNFWNCYQKTYKNTCSKRGVCIKVWWFRQGIWGCLFLLHSTRSLALKSSWKVIKWHLFCSEEVLGEKIIIWVKYGNAFTQKIWQLESKRTRGKRNRKFRTLISCKLFPSRLLPNIVLSSFPPMSLPYSCMFIVLPTPFSSWKPAQFAERARTIYR